MVETCFHSYLVIDYKTIRVEGGMEIFKLFSTGCRDHNPDQGCHSNPLYLQILVIMHEKQQTIKKEMMREDRGICPKMGVIELNWFKKIAQGHIANLWGSQQLNFRNLFFKPSDIFL